MERQLKERLIGAAVLVAVAVIMVPEMFSGPSTRAPAPAEAPGQLKTYRIELQSAPTASVHGSEAAIEAATVEAPAERPVDETATVAASAASSSSIRLGASSADVVKTDEAKSAEVIAAPVTTTAMAEPAKVSGKPPPQVNAAKDNWAVQIGSFGVQETAQQLVAKLRSQGYAAFAMPVKVGGKTLYRVRLGTAAERASAEAVLQKIKASYPSASVVAAR